MHHRPSIPGGHCHSWSSDPPESTGLWKAWIQLPIYTQVNQLICKGLVCANSLKMVIGFLPRSRHSAAQSVVMRTKRLIRVLFSYITFLSLFFRFLFFHSFVRLLSSFSSQRCASFGPKIVQITTIPKSFRPLEDFQF